MHSVSLWIRGLRSSEAAAAQQLWDHFSQRLVKLARARLGHLSRRAVDEEDIALDAFSSLCRGAAEGRLQDVQNRDDLWWILVSITNRKVIDHARREAAYKRGKGLTVAESELDGGKFSLDYLIGEAPTPEYIASLGEEHDRLIGLLREDTLRVVACRRIEGYTAAEIAKDMKVTPRTIERKLRLIRNTWAEDLKSVELSQN